MSQQLPHVRQAYVDDGGHATIPFFQWCSLVDSAVKDGTITRADADAAIRAICLALGSPDGTPGNIPANAMMGSPTIDVYGRTISLKALANSGVGAAIYRITRDGYGRISGTQAATTTNLPEGTNLYFTDGRAQTAVVIDSIADADTNHAPSRNAVFDALALKQPLDTQLTDLAGLTYASNSLKVVRVNVGETGWELATVSSGVTDGDKGDITVTASGATWTIDAGTVTLAKMANMATASVIYRKTAGAGAPEVQTLATLKTDMLLGSVENTALSTWAGSANITTLGTIATGTWSGTAIAANKGGTGQTVYAVGDILYASTTTALSKLAASTIGFALISSGVGAAPTWGKINLSGIASHVAGDLLVASLNGGTGASASTFWCGNGTWATPAGGSSYTVSSTSASYTETATSGEKIVKCTCGISGITVSLPTAVGNTTKLTFKVVDNGGAVTPLTLDGFGAETIDLSLTKTRSAQGSSYTIISDNANWQIIASYL